MKINNDIKDTCYNYEGFNLYEFGRTFGDSKIEKAELNKWNIKLLVLNIIGYNPLKNETMVILSSEDFRTEIKSDKLRVELVRKVYNEIVDKYLLETNKDEYKTIGSLKNLTDEFKGQYIEMDKEESARIEKAFDDEYRFIGKDREECERMNTSLYLDYCEKTYKMDISDFLYTCTSKNYELNTEQLLWLKTLKDIYYNISPDIIKNHLQSYKK